MARITKSPLGAFYGKVGNIVGSRWRSIDYIRSMPTRRKRYAPSEAQLAQATKFKMASAFCKPIRQFLNIGFMDFAQKRMTAVNVAVRNLLANAIFGEYPKYNVDESKVALSDGPLHELIDLKAEVAADKTIILSWKNRADATDEEKRSEVYGMRLYDKNRQFLMLDKQKANVTEVKFTDPLLETEGTIHVWLFRFDPKTRMTSPSQYLKVQLT